MSKIDSSLFSHGGESIRHAFGECPQCGSDLHILNSKKGKFLGCTSYPECDYSQPLHKQTTVSTLKIMEDSHCPLCASQLAVKKGRYGMFIGCTNFPECHYIAGKDEPGKQEQALPCPVCDKGHLKKRSNKTGKTFWSCDQYPGCKYLTNDEPVSEPCPKCHSPILLAKRHGEESVLHCPNAKCDFEKHE